MNEAGVKNFEYNLLNVSWTLCVLKVYSHKKNLSDYKKKNWKIVIYKIIEENKKIIIYKKLTANCWSNIKK